MEIMKQRKVIGAGGRWIYLVEEEKLFKKIQKFNWVFKRIPASKIHLGFLSEKNKRKFAEKVHFNSTGSPVSLMRSWKFIWWSMRRIMMFLGATSEKENLESVLIVVKVRRRFWPLRLCALQFEKIKNNNFLKVKINLLFSKFYLFSIFGFLKTSLNTIFSFLNKISIIIVQTSIFSSICQNLK